MYNTLLKEHIYIQESEQNTPKPSIVVAHLHVQKQKNTTIDCNYCAHVRYSMFQKRCVFLVYTKIEMGRVSKTSMHSLKKALDETGCMNGIGVLGCRAHLMLTNFTSHLLQKEINSIQNLFKCLLVRVTKIFVSSKYLLTSD